MGRFGKQDGRHRRGQPGPRQHGQGDSVPGGNPPSAVADDPPHALCHQQVHLRLPGIRQHLRDSPLQRGEPGALYGRYLSLLVRCHVRRHRPRHLFVPDGDFSGLERANRRERAQARRAHRGDAHRPVHAADDGILCRLRGICLQRLFLPRPRPLWLFLPLRGTGRGRRRGGRRRRAHRPLRERRVRLRVWAGPDVARGIQRAPLFQFLQDEAERHSGNHSDVLRCRPEGHQRGLLQGAPRPVPRGAPDDRLCRIALFVHGLYDLFEVEHRLERPHVDGDLLRPGR
mmetsp:Transcript_15406/g.31586  ORF Transcript_15406/g.31586 Transcript_15406/m.31586 type:complete len:286 (+) Transcript_15406:457-1314(+)